MHCATFSRSKARRTSRSKAMTRTFIPLAGKLARRTGGLRTIGAAIPGRLARDGAIQLDILVASAGAVTDATLNGGRGQ
jgi:hypothetical protein